MINAKRSLFPCRNLLCIEITLRNYNKTGKNWQNNWQKILSSRDIKYNAVDWNGLWFIAAEPKIK
jgi:hypothetical protein